MGSNSVMKGSAPAISKDFGKKKRPNRLAKLKQCKLEARREQWLSHAKNKGIKEESNGGGGSIPLSLHLSEEGNQSLDNSEVVSKGEENEGLSVGGSDVEFIVNNSSTSSEMGTDDSRNDRPGSSTGSSSSLSGCYSRNISEDEEDEEDDDCLDDWEAVADALTAEEKHHSSDAKQGSPVGSLVSSEPVNKGSGESTPMGVMKRAWRPDDAFRPQSFPNLSKQNSFPVSAERQGRRAVTWSCHSFVSQPSSCPICYEDLDVTDSSFLPCSCGFHICLFCHKRILEVDGRCPGCRKHYVTTSGDTGVDGASPQWQFAGSRSTITIS